MAAIEAQGQDALLRIWNFSSSIQRRRRVTVHITSTAVVITLLKVSPRDSLFHASLPDTTQTALSGTAQQTLRLPHEGHDWVERVGGLGTDDINISAPKPSVGRQSSILPRTYAQL